MTKVLIVGHLGNMGRRYAAICDHLKIDWQGYDIMGGSDDYPYTHVIIATPTEAHLGCLLKYGQEAQGRPILIEKPVRKSAANTEKAIRDIDNLFMVNNYAHIHEVRQDPYRSWRTQDTTYSFYNTGADGVYWDCIQLIHLAKRSIDINLQSPIWSCTINGIPINRAQVDRGYVDMIADFVGPQNNLWGYDDIVAAHEKVEAFAMTNSLYCENVPQVHAASKS